MNGDLGLTGWAVVAVIFIVAGAVGIAVERLLGRRAARKARNGPLSPDEQETWRRFTQETWQEQALASFAEARQHAAWRQLNGEEER